MSNNNNNNNYNNNNNNNNNNEKQQDDIVVNTTTASSSSNSVNNNNNNNTSAAGETTTNLESNIKQRKNVDLKKSQNALRRSQMHHSSNLPLPSPSSLRRSSHNLNASTSNNNTSNNNLRDTTIDEKRHRLRKLLFSKILENKGSVARDHLANERTYLAWLRTGLSCIALGVALAKLGTSRAGYPFRYFVVYKQLLKGKFSPNRVGTIVFILLCLGAAIASLVIVLVNKVFKLKDFPAE
ncbi:hypothetical protein DFA_01921 [Cavenderia fasciculata]|uniref:DUF202 domain-containing protein n=1 Tax=Cavenderia fasciculata TaxID=261658 RepID=F4PQS4_CACFS|nr:uncharacterized protein DFA_01921 [Cavenderia fasciculata]EGG22032.1 hypothetical protein DFA_01921 [Cavenderia fasciculata]|eukprot:XP_004359883.1 hypothetical protein DFA_01921 [Cavenderia fasciculata]